MTAYQLTESAFADLDEILAYLGDEAGPTIALRFRSQLFAKFARLADYPGLGHKRSELTTLPVVFFTVDPYLIVYDRRASPIIIHAVLHGARDVKGTLARRDLM